MEWYRVDQVSWLWQSAWLWTTQSISPHRPAQHHVQHTVHLHRWRHHLAHYPTQPSPCHIFGGLLGQSAVDSLHVLTKFIHNAWAHLIDNWVSILLMDIKAAFPSVVPEWLFHNMHMRGLLAEYINWYRTRLTRRSTTLEFNDFVQINHNRALLCPVSETRLWGELQNTNLVPSVRDWREETLGMKISTIQTKQTRENSVTQKPQITWSTWKGNSSSNHCKCTTQHNKSAQTLNINRFLLATLQNR